MVHLLQWQHWEIRSISIDLTIEPKMPVMGQGTQLTLHLTDGKAGQKNSKCHLSNNNIKGFSIKALGILSLAYR